jgi:cysteine sulfinate desulfinase
MAWNTYSTRAMKFVISALEHHANLLPWQQLAKRRALKLVILPLNADG